MKYYKHLFFAGLIFFSTAMLFSFDLKLKGSNNVSATFSIEKDVVITQTFEVRSKNSSGDYFITFSPGLSNTFSQRKLLSGSDEMYYNIYNNSSEKTVLKDLSANPSGGEIISGSITAEELSNSNSWVYREHSYTVIIDRDQFPPAGQYEDSSVEITLYEGAPGNASKINSDTLNISVTMDSYLEMSLVQEGARLDTSDPDYALDFHTLEAGETNDADLVVRSNNNYGVTVRSDHGGVLAIHDENDTSVVPYVLKVNGREQTLTAGAFEPFPTTSGPTSVDGEIFDLSVEILDYGMATEGTYSDILTFTISAH